MRHLKTTPTRTVSRAGGRSRKAGRAIKAATACARAFETATGLQTSSGCKAGPGPESEAALPCDIAGFLRATLCVPAWRDAVLVMAAAGRATALAGAEQFGIFSHPPGLPAKGPALNGPDIAGLDIGGISAAGPYAVGHDAAGLEAGEEPGVKAQCPDSGGRDGNPEPPGYGEVLLGLCPGQP